MNRLRVHVERIVRPISANFGRKDQMREELLAHITTLYEAELEKSDNEALAIENAIEHFGDAAKMPERILQRLAKMSRTPLPFDFPPR